ncbi:MAG TPA: hypothetical protein VJ912_02650 [Candidatus Nanoarchaeia archaeon]|nr:hypothetical protein [Candidatus Nanoarchaeia archaeon]
MDIKILNENENPLFNRKEIKGKIKTESSPKREEVIEALSKKYSTDVDNVKIKGIKGSFGSSEFEIKANIYSSKEERDTVENKKKKETELDKKREEAKKAAEEEKKKAEESKESSEENKESSESEKKE